MLAPLHPVRDLRLSGQVVYTGRSSMEVAVRMEAMEKDGTEETIMLGMEPHSDFCF
jgi:acyl-coenzyme A thioesterase 9